MQTFSLWSPIRRYLSITRQLIEVERWKSVAALPNTVQNVKNLVKKIDNQAYYYLEFEKPEI